eukprot:TRINITY_DN27421_c0_g1_i1.p1 TRINITY_DN27421_c0_g1~~TRINITY_DN27421_c0_g1_i1.p1  ORF type:complete len:653 (+),score=129.58 TRINITY_DN27421_c0_g1_i1:40-1998(+)
MAFEGLLNSAPGARPLGLAQSPPGLGAQEILVQPCHMMPVPSAADLATAGDDRRFREEAMQRVKILQADLSSELSDCVRRVLASLAEDLAMLHEESSDSLRGSGNLKDLGGGPIVRFPLRPHVFFDVDEVPNFSPSQQGVSEGASSQQPKGGNGIDTASGNGNMFRDAGQQFPSQDDREPEREEDLTEDPDFETGISKESEIVAIAEKLGGKRSLNRSQSLPDTNNPCLRSLVSSKYSEVFFSTCIMLNCITMGIEADGLVRHHPKALRTFGDVMEQVFVAIFTIEMFCNLKVYGLGAFYPTVSPMNFVDAMLVIFTGIFFSWVMPFLSAVIGSGFGAGVLRTLSVFRAIRLLRIIRVIQKIPAFKEVWLLLKGLTDSLMTLVWTVVVIAVITYVFAIFGCWIISNEIMKQYEVTSNPKVRADIENVMQWLDGIGPVMQLLLQFLTLDSWNSKMEAITVFAPWCILYFYLYISVAVFVLMNLVTAIIVENAMSASKMDEDMRLKQMEAQKSKEIKELRHLFELMDADGDGTLDWDEFEAAFEDEEMSKKWRLLDFKAEDCKELFELLDDGDGGIETDEFFEGLPRMKGQAASRDLMRVSKNVDKLMVKMNSLSMVLSHHLKLEWKDSVAGADPCSRHNVYSDDDQVADPGRC